MSDFSRNDSTESPSSSSYGGPASPTLVNTPLEEFPPPQPAAFLSRPRVPRLLTPAPHAPIPAGPATAENHLLALGQMSPRSVCAAIASHDLPADTYRSIINGLVVTSEARTHDLPHVCEIYATPKYTADPAEPLPHWIHETLQGSAPAYAAFLNAVKATDDW